MLLLLEGYQQVDGSFNIPLPIHEIFIYSLRFLEINCVCAIS
jgi:hypothetical protein